MTAPTDTSEKSCSFFLRRLSIPNMFASLQQPIQSHMKSAATPSSGRFSRTHLVRWMGVTSIAHLLLSNVPPIEIARASSPKIVSLLVHSTFFSHMRIRAGRGRQLMRVCMKLLAPWILSYRMASITLPMQDFHPVMSSLSPIVGYDTTLLNGAVQASGMF